MKTTPFKICPTCSKPWETFDEFLVNPELELTGYQVNFVDLHGGLFYFNHTKRNCGTTLAIPVKEFTRLSSRPVLAACATPSDNCAGLCIRQGALDPCPQRCECGWVREIMQVILNRKKQAA